MKFLKVGLVIFSILAIIAVSFLWYLNFFSEVKIVEKEEVGFVIAGIEVIGPYSKVGKSMCEVDSKLRKLGIISTKRIGIYYDDPKIIPKEKCRSFVGNILSSKDLQKIKVIESKGLKIDTISKTQALVSEFPVKNSMSYMIGPIKVYPALAKYMEKKKHMTYLAFEIYDQVEKKIIFVMQYNLVRHE